jgi:hypothetical protein
MSDVAMVRATVQRLVHPENELPYVEHRTRDIYALMKEVEWGWSRDQHAAYVFGDISLAELHAKELRAGGAARVYPCVFTVWQVRERELIKKDLVREAAALRSAHEAGVAPEDVYRELEKRHLA